MSNSDDLPHHALSHSVQYFHFLAKLRVTLDLPAHPFELLDESSDFLEHALFFGQVLRIKWAHLGQNGIELSTIVAGELTF